MKCRVGVGICCTVLFCAASSIAEEGASSAADDAHATVGNANLGVASSPGVAQQSVRFAYIGTFTRKGKFRNNSTLGRMKESIDDKPISATEEQEVPPWMRKSSERVVRDVLPSVHATAVAQPKHLYSDDLHRVVTFAYGPPTVLHLPTYVGTDPRNRLILSDPWDHSVHVLDPASKDSFRILGGAEYRLKEPAGVAADSEGNVYVADSDAGVVLVYDDVGRFVRYVGLYHGENWFEHPTGIALDHKRGLLYVADSPRNVVLVLDLQGTQRKLLGRTHNRPGPVELEYPTAVAVDDCRNPEPQRGTFS